MTQHRGGAGNFAEDRQKLLKQVVKAARIVVVILKTIPKGHQKQGKRWSE